MLTNWIILDVSSAAIPDAGVYLDPVSAPASYKKPEAIAAYVYEKTAERIASAGLDLDLARVTGFGFAAWDASAKTTLCRTHEAEVEALKELADIVGITIGEGESILTYNGFSFDLPLVMRRARYLGVPFPTINLDRYKSPHVDLLQLLSDRDPTRRRSLGFYARRLHMGLTKPLSGEEESRIFEHQRWGDLEASLRHDVTAIHRLAQWLGMIQ